jgi:hypothetical protein
MTLAYGHEFLRRWDGMDLSAVKADWAHELRRFHGNREAIAYGLSNLPVGRPPTVLEFRSICHSRPQQTIIPIDPPAVPKAKIAALMAKLSAPPPAAPEGEPDLRWARQIMARHKRGERVRQAVLTMAEEALRGRQTA